MFHSRFGTYMAKNLFFPKWAFFRFRTCVKCKDLSYFYGWVLQGEEEAKKSKIFFPLVPLIFPWHLAPPFISPFLPPLPQLLFSPPFSACVNFYDSHFPSFLSFWVFFFAFTLLHLINLGLHPPTLSLPPFFPSSQRVRKKTSVCFYIFFAPFSPSGERKVVREIFFSLSGCPLPKIDVYLIWVGTKVKKRTKTLQNVIVWEEEGLNPPIFWAWSETSSFPHLSSYFRRNKFQNPRQKGEAKRSHSTFPWILFF